MVRTYEWLEQRHSELSKQVEAMEKERTSIRSPEHKAKLTELKKQKLKIKTQLDKHK